MKFSELLDTVAELPVFRTGILLAGDRDPLDVRRQLARWKAAGKVLQLRRNLYALAPPWRRVRPHPFVIANELQRPSYVSLQSALAYHGSIPEAVPITTSVTTGRPFRHETPLGRFIYRHIAPSAFFGYQKEPVLPDQTAFVADAAKALLDLAYLTPRGDSPAHLRSLRLEGVESIADRLLAHARRWDKPKVRRAVEHVLQMQETAPVEGARS
ncbi:MAG: hypothetical protein ACE5HT_17230 [Gemmatimonadales bacterium]